jgi:transcriptional regulator with XRE-family HTH domain
MALGYLSEVELGKKDISSELLESLANSLGLSLGTLIERVAVVLIDTEQQTEMRIEKEMTITN